MRLTGENDAIFGVTNKMTYRILCGCHTRTYSLRHRITNEPTNIPQQFAAEKILFVIVFCHLVC